MKFVKTFEKFTGGQVAYHGSPYSFSSFEFGKTGVNTKNWGWGLYFTSNRDVARYYADISLAEDFYGSGLSIKVDGIELKDKVKKWAEVYQKARNILRTWGKDKVNDFCRLMRKEFPDLKDYFKPKHITLKYDAKKWLYDVTATSGLKIEDWDSKPSRELLAKLDSQFHSNRYSTTYKSISNKLGGDEEASKYLLDLGIDGHVYKGYKGEDNWVIYDVSKLAVANKEEVGEITESLEEKEENTKPTLTDEQIDRICEFYNYCEDNGLIFSGIYAEIYTLLDENGISDRSNNNDSRPVNPTTFKTWVRNMSMMWKYEKRAQKNIENFNEKMIVIYNEVKDFKKHDTIVFDEIESCVFDLLSDNDNLNVRKTIGYSLKRFNFNWRKGESWKVIPSYQFEISKGGGIYNERDSKNTVTYRGKEYTSLHDLYAGVLSEENSILHKKLDSHFENVEMNHYVDEDYGDTIVTIIVIK
jgi:hypothetical protein